MSYDILKNFERKWRQKLNFFACILYELQSHYQCFKNFYTLLINVFGRYAGILSAYGMALADVVYEAQEPCAKAYNPGMHVHDTVNVSV